MKKPSVEERRTEILETTCEVVIERGFAGTPVTARSAGVFARDRLVRLCRSRRRGRPRARPAKPLGMYGVYVMIISVLLAWRAYAS